MNITKTITCQGCDTAAKTAETAQAAGAGTESVPTAAYCRVSTDADMQDGSFETQKRHFENYISAHPGMTLVEVYGDQGRSGRCIEKREEFQRMMRDAGAGKFKRILTKSVSRFARNMGDCVRCIRKLQEYGVSVYFEREALDTVDEKSELILSIMATIAEEESRSIAENLAWTRKKRYAQGRPWEHPGYGYRYVKEDNTWRVEREEAKVVKAAFRLALEGKNYTEIVAELNRMEECRGGSRRWSRNTLRYLLKNICYTGDYMTNKTYTTFTEQGRRVRKNSGQVEQFFIEGHHEGIVSREIFELAGELIGRKLLCTGKKMPLEETDRLLLERCRKAVRQLNDRRPSAEESLCRAEQEEEK